jgi:uncharacterized repeat protein (TIGR01451 family)
MSKVRAMSVGGGCRRGRPTAGALLLLLGWGSVAPASATITLDAGTDPLYVNATTNSSVTEPIVVNPGGSLYIQDGGAVTVTDPGSNAVEVDGGTVSITGGSVSSARVAVATTGGTASISGGSVSGGDGYSSIFVGGGAVTISAGSMISGAWNSSAVFVNQGTATISGGSISGVYTGVDVYGGIATISGGSISTSYYGVNSHGGTTSITGGSISAGGAGVGDGVAISGGNVSITGGSISAGGAGIAGGLGAVNIYGSCLALSGSLLTGALQDGAAVNTNTVGLTAASLINTNLSFGMSAGPSPVVTGSQLTYVVTATNPGSATMQNPVLSDPLPAGTSFVGATVSPSVGTLTTPKGKSNTIIWSMGSLPPVRSCTLTVVVKVSAKAGSMLTNTATLTSTCPQGQTQTYSASVPASVIAKR